MDKEETINKETIEMMGDNHVASSIETPLRDDAFEKSDEEKIENIQLYFYKIMEELGLDLTDDSLSGTPYRVAKMYVKELFHGLNPANKPKVSTFENKYNYKKLLIEQDIEINSNCEHHFLPIIGKAHVAYIPGKRVVGLSKINRIVNYIAHRPQVQERLCLQIYEELKSHLDTEDIIVCVQAKHLCVSTRGINDKESFTTSLEYGGEFNKTEKRDEFLTLLNLNYEQ